MSNVRGYLRSVERKLSFLAFTLLTSAFVVSISRGQTAESRQQMSTQFREHARRAFHAVEALDPDDPHVQTQRAHQLVNGLLDNVKAPLDKEVQNILFTWLAEIELGKRVEPAVWRRWMRAEVDCQTEAEFFFGGLTEDGKKKAAQKIADKTCFVEAKQLGVPTATAR